MAVRPFARSIVAQDGLAIEQGVVKLIHRLVVIHELVEDRQVLILEPLALIETPVVIPTVEQFTAIEGGGGAQGLDKLGRQVAAGGAVGHGRGALEDGHVQPQVGLGVQLNPVTVEEQQLPFGRVGLLIKGGLELPQCLAQIVLGVGRRLVAPQDVGQRFAGVGAVAEEQQVAEELLGVVGVKGNQPVLAMAHFQLSEQRDV